MKKFQMLLAIVLALAVVPIVARPAIKSNGPTVIFTVNPSILPTGHSVSTLLCASPSDTAGKLTFNQNDVFGFNVNSGIGTVTAVDTPIMVNSSTLSASDFTASLNQANPNNIAVQYATAAS